MTALLSLHLAAPRTADAGPARRAVRDAIAAECGRATADDAEVVAGELIANAVLHAPGPIRIDVDRSGRDVRIAVTDTGRSVAPRPGSAPPATATRGRGLLIVAALSTGWGWTADDAAGTKTVHATVACGRSTDGSRPGVDA